MRTNRSLLYLQLFGTQANKTVEAAMTKLAVLKVQAILRWLLLVSCDTFGAA